MLGLIKKDLLMIRSNLKTLIIIFFVYGIMSFQVEMNLSFILPFMSLMIMISSFSYDAFNKWDAYVITLPSGRKNSVRAKYLATIILLTITTLITTIITLIISYVQNKILDLDDILAVILGTVFATTLLQSFMYPSIYKFGVEKARIGIFIGVFGISIIGGIMAKYCDFESLFQVLDVLNNYGIIIISIVIIVMLYISYKISEKIYNKKEY